MMAVSSTTMPGDRRQVAGQDGLPVGDPVLDEPLTRPQLLDLLLELAAVGGEQRDLGIDGLRAVSARVHQHPHLLDPQPHGTEPGQRLDPGETVGVVAPVPAGLIPARRVDQPDFLVVAQRVLR
jgi:hypothetical protein